MIRSTTLWKATHSVFNFASYALIGSAYESSSYHFALLLVVARHHSSILYTNCPSYPPLAFPSLYSVSIPQTCLLSRTCSTFRLWRWTKEVSASLSFIRLAACIWLLQAALMYMRGYDFLVGSDYCSNALCGWELRPLARGVVDWSACIDGLFIWGFFSCGVTYRWKVSFDTWMIWLSPLL